MTVGELVIELLKQDQAREVICMKDTGGNGFSPLRGMSTGVYRPTSTYSGESGLEELTDKDRDVGFTEEDLIPVGVDGAVRALFLHPTI